jgi:hypothetical protein
MAYPIPYPRGYSVWNNRIHARRKDQEPGEILELESR